MRCLKQDSDHAWDEFDTQEKRMVVGIGQSTNELKGAEDSLQKTANEAGRRTNG